MGRYRDASGLAVVALLLAAGCGPHEAIAPRPAGAIAPLPAGAVDPSPLGVAAVPTSGASAAPMATPAPAEPLADAAAWRPSIATPSPAATLPPPGVAPPRDLRGPTGPLIAFASNRPHGDPPGDGRRDFDLYLYDMAGGTVFVPPGANTPGDELDPILTGNARWLVYASNGEHGDFDIVRYDLTHELVDLLPRVNTPADEVSPSLSDDGRTLAYARVEAGVPRLTLAHLPDGEVWLPVEARRLAGGVTNPQISNDGRIVVFGAPTEAGDLDVWWYDVVHGDLRSPPFVNSPANDDDPILSADGRSMLFVSDRRGSRDVYWADLRTGYIDDMPLANTPAAEEDPGFAGTDQVIYETTRDGDRRFVIYDRVKERIDTLPAMHEPGSDDL